MAVGLKLGEKVGIGTKNYRVINDVVDVSAMLGDVVYVETLGNLSRREDVRQQDGSVQSVDTGEIIGVELEVLFRRHNSREKLTVVSMPLPAIEDLGLGFRDEIELVNPVVTISSIDGSDTYKVFADAIRKKAAGVKQEQPKKEENQNKHNG